MRQGRWGKPLPVVVTCMHLKDDPHYKAVEVDAREELDCNQGERGGEGNKTEKYQEPHL